MMRIQGADERRENTRFSVRDQVFARIIADAVVMGEVLDVSEGGLGLKYVKYLAEDGVPQGRATVDVFGHGGRVYVLNMPATMVFDLEMPIENAFCTVGMRRMGVAFGALTHAQQSQLRSFIKENSRHYNT